VGPVTTKNTISHNRLYVGNIDQP